MITFRRSLIYIALLPFFFSAVAALITIAPARADTTSATVQALRLNGIITGGAIPSTDPVFQTMVGFLMAGDAKSAAIAAVNSQYFGAYLPRRMAKEMMTPQLLEPGIPDNDATTFIVANFLGSSTGTPAAQGSWAPSIKSLWSQNATYVINVKVDAKGVPLSQPTPLHAFGLSAAQLAAVNWQTDLIQLQGQTARVFHLNENINPNTPVTIPLVHVGGYTTLNFNGANPAIPIPVDNSFASFAFTAGTNLRAIEGIYEIATGLTLQEMIVSAGATVDTVPRFVPELDPNFFTGHGQPACMSCHAGGPSNLTHGYATVADIFDFDPDINGLSFKNGADTEDPVAVTMKSLGSNAGNRAAVLACNLSANSTTVCNPDSSGVSSTQAWDLKTWQDGGILAKMGWQGSVSGNGLNSLGQALGQAKLVFQFMTQRVIKEICPLGTFSVNDVNTIAADAQNFDSFRIMVADVASNPSCF